MRNQPGKCVMLKVDSGPGRMNLILLARQRHLGFILYPCIPNTSHIKDRSVMVHLRHSSWRTSIICEARLRKNVSLSLQPKFVGGMVHARVAHFVTPLKCTYDECKA